MGWTMNVLEGVFPISVDSLVRNYIKRYNKGKHPHTISARQMHRYLKLLEAAGVIVVDRPKGGGQYRANAKNLQQPGTFTANIYHVDFTKVIKVNDDDEPITVLHDFMATAAPRKHKVADDMADGSAHGMADGLSRD